MEIGVYVHIPFCRQKCYYCDFPSAAGSREVQKEYTKALCQEIAVQGSSLSGETATTLYIGGGTPTLLADELLAGILTTLQQAFCWSETAEVTIEANPGTVTREKLDMLRRGGINRISFGVQSFDDELLKRIGRIHSGNEAMAAIDLARAAGFENISLDLMYGLPGQSLSQLKASVETALALEIEHISIYGLQLEEGTILAQLSQQGALELPDEEAVEIMYDYITGELPRCGYERYEISNFARRGFASRHNLGYWLDRPYIGLGAAAHSYYKNRRFANVAGVDQYITSVFSGTRVAFEEESMTREILMEEFCFLALRTSQGILAEAFARKFDCSLWSVYGAIISQLTSQKLLQVDENGCRLTCLGMKYGNQVFAAFLLDE